jgi:LuxR family maltose regulon positive regulatory protein
MVQNNARARASNALAKVSPPVNAQALSRNHLFERINALRDHQAIWISSPAGSGKTTLVSTYLENRKIPCLWYQVDVGDDDPATFFYYLGRAAVSSVPRIRKAFPSLTQEYLLGLPTFTMRFFEDLCSHLLSHYPKTAKKQENNAQGFTLVFDNCQDVSDASPFHNILLNGLARVPSEISVIFISRTSPPPAYARMLANAQMGLLGWDDLRLTQEETKQIICQQTGDAPPQETIEHIHRATQGWAAGITLMVGEIRREGFHELLPQGSTPEEIMYYFGTELFERLDETRKDFLLKTAFLPKMTVQMARDLTGNDESGRILTGLYRNNFFIHKHFQTEPSYEYHPLFREFLINAARETIFGEELTSVMRSAASMLEAGGQLEAAMDLLEEISGYENMVPTIIEHAPGLIEQGRYRALQEWLASIPNEVMEKNPWLIYWKGASLLAFNPIDAKKIFEHAFERFKNEDLTEGILISVSGIIQAIQLQFASQKQYDPWIPVIENIFQTNEKFPSKEIEGKIVEGMLTALVARQPDHPRINEWIERAYSFLDQPISITLKARLIFAPMFYYIYQWNVSKWKLTHDLLKPLAKTKDIPPMAALIVHFGEVYYHVLKANHEECLAIAKNALRIANESGVHVLDYAFLTEAAMSCLNENDLQQAREFIDKLTEHYDHLTLREKRGFHNAKAREAMMQKDYPQAVCHARKTIDLAMEMGSELFICVGHFVMSQALHLIGEHEEEHVHIEESFIFPQEIKGSTLNFYGTLAKAVCAYDLGDDASGDDYLKEAFVIGREHKHFATYVDIPSQTAKLCHRGRDRTGVCTLAH